MKREVLAALDYKQMELVRTAEPWSEKGVQREGLVKLRPLCDMISCGHDAYA